MRSTTDKLVDDYLARLNRELAGFSRARRRELVEEISAHIAEARGDLAQESEAEIRTLLDRIGEPADIAAEARERFEVRPKKRDWDVPALILLLIGGVVLPVIGWLVGVVLLWVSETWTTREKLIGTLVVPGGLFLPLFLATYPATSEVCSDDGSGVTCTGGPSLAMQVIGVAVYVVLILAPFATTAFLARRRSRALAIA